MSSVKSRQIDERKECASDFYRLIDTININQIRFTEFYRLTNRYRFLSTDYVGDLYAKADSDCGHASRVNAFWHLVKDETMANHSCKTLHKP